MSDDSRHPPSAVIAQIALVIGAGIGVFGMIYTVLNHYSYDEREIVRCVGICAWAVLASACAIALALASRRPSA